MAEESKTVMNEEESKRGNLDDRNERMMIMWRHGIVAVVVVYFPNCNSHTADI